ncbi:MAG: NAD+ synthase [Anaerolineae bacterium]
MRVAMAQLNPLVGDIRGNGERIAQTMRRYRQEAPDLMIFPEFFLTGYPPRDLLERDWFISRVLQGVEKIEELSLDYPDTGILFGAPIPTNLKTGKPLYNAAILAHCGEIVATSPKSLLPSYDVFDEVRYFEPASEITPVPFKGEILGIHVCEDAWADPAFWGERIPYKRNPLATLADKGTTLFVNISASPFHVGKERIRYSLLQKHAQTHSTPFIYVNQIGGNDELIFDGRSLALDPKGRTIAVLPSFQEYVEILETEHPGAADTYAPMDDVAAVHEALILGLRDYMEKCDFSRAVVGLSGGIDSSLTCYLAAQALGAENVLGVSMPGPYSSPGSIRDAQQLAENLGIGLQTIPISSIFRAYLDGLGDPLAGTEPDVTEENIQARIRGNILMALSNKFGYLVLSTGNKSELAVGYCTLYGDMSGGLAVISDLPKTMVYKLAHYANREGEIIPRASIEKPPSAELKPDQIDQDTLPPYPILDEILRHYVEEGCSVEMILDLGFEEETVRWVVEKVDGNEYKRRQAAPGLRVTTKAFGTGRRMPIAAKFTQGEE